MKTSRRAFLKTAAAVSAGVAIRSEAAARKKPNLLFLWTDEQRADTMAAYGNARIPTPHLNRLGSESVVFERAYVTQPVCTPSRCSVMTGLWPHTTGLTSNNIPLPADVPCFPELLDDPDYATGYMGKWHLGNEVFAQHGFDEWVSIEDTYFRYFTEGRDKGRRSDYHHFLLGKGYAPDNPRDHTFSRAFAARRPLEHCKPKFLEERAVDFLKRHRDRPFVLYVNFLEPHMPFFGPLDGAVRSEDVYFPASFFRSFGKDDPLRHRLRRIQDGKTYGTAEREIRALIARYWGLVAQVDLSVGAILDALDRLGLKENTVVVYTSDHGDMMGAHGMVAKSVMYEEAVRIPWLMRIPRLGFRQKKIRTPVSHIDLMPTLLELMDAKTKPSLPGRSLVPFIRGGRPAEDHVFIEWNADRPESGAGEQPGNIPEDVLKQLGAAPEVLARAVASETRTVIAPDGWKLCLTRGDQSQLFNLNADPGETVNLFYSVKHGDVVKRLTDKIRRWQEKVQDPIVL